MVIFLLVALAAAALVIAALLAERARLARALARSRARLRTLVDTLPFDLWVVGEDGRYSLLNASSSTNWGSRVGDRPGDVAASPEVRAMWLENNRRAFAGQTVRGEEVVVQHGRRRVFVNLLAPIRVGGRVTSVLGASIDVTEQRETAKELTQLLERLQRRHAAVVALAESQPLREGDMPAAARVVTETAARTVGVRRAGFWLVSPDARQLDCLHLLDTETGPARERLSLRVEDYPRYFEALASLRCIDASDARSDPRTSEFRRGYLDPFGISSMLDAAIRVAGETVGVLCLEHAGPKRAWTADEISFVTEAADLAAQAFVNHQRRLAEERLRESEADFRRLVQLTPVALAITDRRSNITLINDQFVATFGYTAEDLPTVEAWWPLAYPDPAYRAEVRARWEPAVAECLATGRPIEPQEYKVTCKDGSVRDVVFRLNFLANRTIYSLDDVTEFRRAEARLRQSEANFRDLLLRSPVPLLVADADGRVTLINEQFVAAFGYSPGELPTLGHWMERAYPDPERQAQARDTWREVSARAAEAGVLPAQERRVTCKDGSARDVIFHVRLFGGQLIFILQDVTAERAARGELARHRDRLEELVGERTAELEREIAERRRAEEQARSADRLKSAFLATMSHELRTPLNSILGFTGLLLKGLPGPLNDEQRKQLGMVQGSSRHLLSLINDVLDLSKIEAGQMVLHPAPFDLAGAVKKAADAVSPLAHRKGLSLTAEVAAGVGPVVADARRVEQVLLNLLSNAIKFTERGEVSVRCEARGPWAVTVVRDTGVGIAADDLAGLFQPFHQIDTGLSRRHEGTGLGLTICRRLVTMMGGAIRAVSEPGRGSTFIFTLPLAYRSDS